MTRSAAVVGLIAIAACTSGSSPNITEGVWIYESYTDGGEAVPVEVDVNAIRQPFLVIEDGELSGFSGCNGFGGDFEYADGVLRPGEIFSETAGCMPETLMDSELAFQEVIWGDGTIAVSVEDDTMRWRRGAAMLTFTHADEPPPEPTIPPQTSVGALDCGDEEVVTEEVPSEGTNAEKVAFAADDRVTEVTVEGELRHHATGYDSEGNVLVVVSFQDVDPFPYRIHACP
ncbi:MAG TPA: META domain-containing protein [Acidimicrobiia bacterium]|nr:META domain-containing protein [Acidimicrobiia bacterium]